MKALRKLWESTVYAGMRPGTAPSDPLYLSNRTLGQRIRTALLVAGPCLIVVGLVALGVGHHIRVRDEPQRQLTPAELAKKILPNLEREGRIVTNHDLEVVEARIEASRPIAVYGTVKNNTSHAIENAVVVFDLVDGSGARLGAVAAKIAHVDPKSTAPFRVIAEQEHAAYALVREVVLR